jgi:DNA (cytosine-5)-methyltransferase 1
MNERPTHIDLFSGIGGFSLAAEEAGWQTTAFCENEPYCQEVLQRHWPEVPIVENIHEFDGKRHKGVSLCTGGFPCQGFSHAGERRGCDDNRYLWPEMFRIIKESRPSFVVAENVVGIISVALDTVLSDLESEGYSTGTVVLPACAVNAPHRRDRVWILADSQCERQEGDGPRYKSRRQAGLPSGNGAPMANSGEPGLQGPEQSKTPCESAWASRPTAERGGFTGSDWSIEPDVGRVVDGLPKRSHRLKGLGNAIVPALCYEILKTIYECEQI